ncbi:hypothetical protein A3844_26195 [Paenibacillus helianthi]|uniref:Uncharacterized protein n=1 Tax=Paenibacillus helianthi TaxID=1349432 RepID=A0ABX3EH33_9BACL|nr:hypothetical protein A3844_26195 [Paenibacillus helianthi]
MQLDSVEYEQVKAKEPGVSQVERQNKLDDGQVGDAIIVGYILYFEVVLCGEQTISPIRLDVLLLVPDPVLLELRIR